jgi:hypothetical protein
MIDVQCREARLYDLTVYRFGLVHCSVCVPKDTPTKEVERNTNLEHPTGLDHGWTIAPDPFRTGEPNPCVCNHDPERLHYLMVC